MPPLNACGGDLKSYLITKSINTNCSLKAVKLAFEDNKSVFLLWLRLGDRAVGAGITIPVDARFVVSLINNFENASSSSKS